MVVGVDPRGDFGAIWGGLLRGVHTVGVKHAGKLHFKLVGSIQGKGVVEAIFVVSGGDDLRDDKLAIASGHHGSIAEVGMFVEKAVVLLMNADGVLDHSGFPCTS